MHEQAERIEKHRLMHILDPDIPGYNGGTNRLAVKLPLIEIASRD